jgi:ppGpp synthetase/RelA/SpoT-type nucleotidyltranferase
MHTKGEVNRAGELLERAFFPSEVGGAPFSRGFDVEELGQAVGAIAWWKERHAAPLSRVAASLRYHVDREDGQVDGEIDVAQRLKKRDTIIGKLHRFENMKLTQMHDIGGVRATLPSLDCVAAVSRRLRRSWTIARTRDYIGKPKISGYRAIHHDVLRDGVYIEVQLRTVRQHAWANQVEDDGRRLGTGYKFGFGADEVHAYYRTMGEAFHLLDRGEELPAGLMKELSEGYENIQPILRSDDPRSQS